MATLAHQRCFNHDSREAVCRCPSCHNFFCRECVVLFDTRLLCANCLAGESAEHEPERANRRFGMGTVALMMLGVLVAWLLFYFAGWTILQFREHTPMAFLAAASFRVP